MAKHLCTTADLSFWRAVNALLVMNHGEAPALAGEVRDYFSTDYPPRLVAEKIAYDRLGALEAVL